MQSIKIKAFNVLQQMQEKQMPQEMLHFRFLLQLLATYSLKPKFYPSVVYLNLEKEEHSLSK